MTPKHLENIMKQQAFEKKILFIKKNIFINCEYFHNQEETQINNNIDHIYNQNNTLGVSYVQAWI